MSTKIRDLPVIKIGFGGEQIVLNADVPCDTCTCGKKV